MVKTREHRSKRSVVWSIPKETLTEWVTNSKTFTDILKMFKLCNKGGNCKTLKRRLTEENINFSHIKLGQNSNLGKRFNFNMSKEECLKNVFVENSTYLRSSARKYIKMYNLILYECCCGLKTIWENKPLSLQLEHKNGVDNDHRLENLEWMCPNCHSQTKTFAGRKKRFIGM